MIWYQNEGCLTSRIVIVQECHSRLRHLVRHQEVTAHLSSTYRPQESTLDLHAVSIRAFIPFNISEVFSLLSIKIIPEEDLDSARVDNLTVGIISSNRVLFSVARTQLHQYLLSAYRDSIDLSWVLLDRSSYDLYQRLHSTSVIFILCFACIKIK